MITETLTSKGQEDFPIKPDINRADYIQIYPSILIAKEKTHEEPSWRKIHNALAEEGLFMPPPYLFMTHFLQVREAAAGNMILYDGEGTPIPQKEVNELYRERTIDSLDKADTCLDAYFVRGVGALGLDLRTNHRIRNVHGKKELHFYQYPLQETLQEDHIYAALVFNQQGFPITLSNQEMDLKGSNKGTYMKFRPPQGGYVAWFGAGFGRPNLICNCRRPEEEGEDKVGVLACAKI